jgi:transcriptional regulator with XRE-family HTH domain
VGYIRNEKALILVGKNIKRLRESKGYSQREFADICNMESSQIGRIELGKINTSVSVLFKIAEVLQIKPSELLDVEGYDF